VCQILWYSGPSQPSIRAQRLSRHVRATFPAPAQLGSSWAQRAFRAWGHKPVVTITIQYKVALHSIIVPFTIPVTSPFIRFSSLPSRTATHLHIYNLQLDMDCAKRPLLKLQQAIKDYREKSKKARANAFSNIVPIPNGGHWTEFSPTKHGEEQNPWRR